MAKIITDKLTLDAEVVAFVKRVGEYPSPGNYISEYTVNRRIGDFTRVTVTLIADEKFSDVEKENSNG